MKLHLLAFGIAKDILHGGSVSYDLIVGDRISDLKQSLLETYPDFVALTSLSFAVNETYVTDDHRLKEGDEIVLIPPVSGG